MMKFMLCCFCRGIVGLCRFGLFNLVLLCICFVVIKGCDMGVVYFVKILVLGLFVYL